MPEYYSYREQTAHYFSRVHDGVLEQPLESAASWRSRDFKTDLWRVRLTDHQIDEINAAILIAERSRKATGDLSATDFSLPSLQPEIARWRVELDAGRGFQVVSGLPVEQWSAQQAEIFFWCIGLHMGVPGAQNPQGDLLGHVRDTGDRATDPFVRLYRTASNIAYHCDAADAVGLLCLKKAASGGQSRIVSSVAVYNELLHRRPEFVKRLYEPFLLDVRNEDQSGEIRYLPIPPCRFAEGRLRTFYHSDYFRSVARHADVHLTREDMELLNLYEEIALDPSFYLEMDLEPGEIQWLSNHSILHARTAYQDHEAAKDKRHLLRLWLSLLK